LFSGSQALACALTTFLASSAIVVMLQLILGQARVLGL
jgi:hypothetical protein